ncbi:hypothetical protein LQ772_06805 [Frateuria edaphi]|uniref:hypothetical protein n=1 Tax=Frateuria edaphi TaxID=2898793 RepID=UPI001E3846D2|nr:hypothetical protein [Frateuria edaphi]UGB46995.1 hypothetical protein LQ772_06805 [Frateuria edaphi]
MKDGIEITADHLQDVVKAIHRLTGQEILVGVPQANTLRRNDDQTSITNAEIGYLQETGSPAMNIPARPFLVPGVEAVQKQVTQQLEKGAHAALDGTQEQVDKAFHAAGLVAQNGVRHQINDGDFQPLAEATLAARRRRGRTGTKPLIDTGQLRNSITYVIRNKD